MKIKALILSLTSIMVCVLLPSCVHEFPDYHREREVILHISHNLEWTYHEMTISRGDDDLRALARYHIQVFREGESKYIVYETEFTHWDLERGEFSYPIRLNEGTYDIYVWSDYADSESGQSMFFDSTDFSGIIYTTPYNGNNMLRDSFRGMTKVKVEESIMDDYKEDVEIVMERPLAHYEFRATDLMDFIDKETTRGRMSDSSDSFKGKSRDEIIQRLPELSKYTVKMIYTGYMPSKYNNVLDRPVDSMTGMSYDAKIEILSEEEARLGFDHVMVNGSESSIPVAMEIYDPDGNMIGSTNTITVPTKRGRSTIIRGRFLTSSATGGIGINPDFDGDYNIEIK